MFFFFKQKTAYEMRISDWSSDVCSSDLAQAADRKLEKIQREQQQDANRLSSQGDLARATIVDLAQQQGKLNKVYVPARANEKGAVVNTKSGALVEERNFVAQQKAQRLRNGDSVERNNLRRLYHSERGVNARSEEHTSELQS